MTVSFNVTRDDREIISKIAFRAVSFNATTSLLDYEMDVTEVHANDCPLNLQGLLAADNFNFIHDVFGIGRHLDRETGELTDCFRPRFSLPE